MRRSLLLLLLRAAATCYALTATIRHTAARAQTCRLCATAPPSTDDLLVTAISGDGSVRAHALDTHTHTPFLFSLCERGA